jgi:hypothetical protein
MSYQDVTLVHPTILLKDGHSDADLAPLIEKLNELLRGQHLVVSVFNEGSVGGAFGGNLRTVFDRLEGEVKIDDTLGTRVLLIRTTALDIQLPIQTLKPGGDLSVRCPSIEINGAHIKLKNPYVDADQHGRRILWQHYNLTAVGPLDAV